jgi:hypothetical protein
MPAKLDNDSAPSRPEAFPRAYAGWHRRMLVGAIVATALGNVLHGSSTEIHIDLEGEQPAALLVLGLVGLVIAAVAPALVGSCFALAAAWYWRRLGRSSRLARAAWVIWVLGPLPVLLLPLSHLFHLNAHDSLKTSTKSIEYIFTVTAPALFALLPGTLSAALILKRFIPESRAPGQITLLAAPACAVSYLIPLAAVTQLAFVPWLYVGLLLLALSPLVPLFAIRGLLRRDTTRQVIRLLYSVAVAQTAVGALGLALIVRWVGEHPFLSELVGQLNWVWAVGLIAKVLASKWLTTVVVMDVLISLMHQGRESTRYLADTTEGKSLAQKLDVLHDALRPAGPPIQ